jgi:hypothetical protein
MALEVYFKHDIENSLRGIASAFDASRLIVEDERDQAIVKGFHAALDAVALSYGIDLEDAAAIRAREGDR